MISPLDGEGLGAAYKLQARMPRICLVGMTALRQALGRGTLPIEARDVQFCDLGDRPEEEETS